VTNIAVADTRSKTDRRKEERKWSARKALFLFREESLKCQVFIVTGPRAELLLVYKELTVWFRKERRRTGGCLYWFVLVLFRPNDSLYFDSWDYCEKSFWKNNETVMTCLRNYRPLWSMGRSRVTDIRIKIRTHYIPKTRSDDWTPRIDEWVEG
jgi:hypothetical protein